MNEFQLSEEDFFKKIKSTNLYIILYSILPVLYFIIYLVPFMYQFIKAINEDYYLNYTAVLIVYLLFLTFIFPCTLYSIIYFILSLVNLNSINRNIKTLQENSEFSEAKYLIIAGDISRQIKVIKVLRIINLVMYIIVFALLLMFLIAEFEDYSTVFVLTSCSIIVTNIVYMYIVDLNKLEIRVPFEFKSENEKQNSWDNYKYQNENRWLF